MCDGECGTECVFACVYPGPLDSADQEGLERLYTQAKGAYYSGRPILDDAVFDSVEEQLRYYRSALVEKWPRCSLRGLRIYSDAEADNSMDLALSGVWAAVAVTGGGVFLAGAAYGASRSLGGLWGLRLAVACALVGGAVAVRQGLGGLRGIDESGTVGLKGPCPSCNEEVYSYVRVPEEGEEAKARSECHCCGQPLTFHAYRQKIPEIAQGPASAWPRGAGGDFGKKDTWTYGRIYSERRAQDYGLR